MSGQRSRRRWLWAAVAVVVVVVACGLAWWVTAGRRSVSTADCAVVEDVARQWNANAAAVRDTLLNGGGRPEDYRAVAERQQQMADRMRGAVDSVDAADIKTDLRRWADGAADLAALQTAAAEEPDGQARPSDTDFERVARSMNDAAESLGEQCPAMPSAT